MSRETRSVSDQQIYKSKHKIDHEKESVWSFYKTVYDGLFKEGLITHDEWLFCISETRRMLGLFVVV